MTDDLQVRLLGPVTVLQGDVPIQLGPPRQQAALAALALRAGRAMTMDQLIGGLWEGDPPKSAEQSVYTYVAGLRQALEPERGRRQPSRLLVRSTGGYALCVATQQVDVGRMTQLLERARRARQAGDHRDGLRCLTEALGLWQGAALSGLPGPLAEHERTRLEDLRTEAVEWHAQALIELGRPQEALDELTDVMGRHPLREDARELAMVALRRLDRPAQALRVFEEGRRILATELGIDPSEGLRHQHQLVLRGKRRPPPEAPVPRQLPRDLGGFVGRARELIELRGHLAPWDGSTPHPTVVISGPPGVGKSTLAIRVAHQIRDRFPDGDLYVSLRGATPGIPPLLPTEVVSRLLRALGVPEESVPPAVDEAAAVLRDRLSGKRILVLLDDAAGLGQIEAVLGIPEGNAVLVTSRESLLAGDDCVQLSLPRMTEPEAMTLLAKLVGAERVSDDLTASSSLVRLCEGLPLTLKIVGARLAAQPGWTAAAFSERLADEHRRLSELEVGDLAVRSSFLASWTALRGSPRSLDNSAADVLVQLGILHVPLLTPGLVAILSDVSSAEAERSLERLADAHLVDRAHPGHYYLHDLVRLYVSELPAREPRAALVRALGFYVSTARRASVLLDPHRVQPAGPRTRAVPLDLRDRAQALAWLDAEEYNIRHAALQAMAHSDPAVALLGVALAFAMLWYQQGAHRGLDLVELNGAALRVGREQDDQGIVRTAHGHLSLGLRMLSRLSEAIEHLEIELELSRAAGDSFGEQRALGNLATACTTAGQYERGLGHAGEQLALARELGSSVGERYALIAMAEAAHGLGRHEEARSALDGCLPLARQAGDTAHESAVHMILGEVLLSGESAEGAREAFLTAIRQHRECGYKIGELRCLIGLSRTLRSLKEYGEALEVIVSAMPLARSLQNVRWKRQFDEEYAAVHGALGVAPVESV